MAFQSPVPAEPPQPFRLKHDALERMCGVLLSSLLLLNGYLVWNWSLSHLLVVLWFDAVALVAIGLPLMILLSTRTPAERLVKLAVYGAMLFLFSGLLVNLGETVAHHATGARVNGAAALMSHYAAEDNRPAWLLSLAVFTVCQALFMGWRMRQAARPETRLSWRDLKAVVQPFTADVIPMVMGLSAGLIAHALSGSVVTGFTWVVCARIFVVFYMQGFALIAGISRR